MGSWEPSGSLVSRSHLGLLESSDARIRQRPMFLGACRELYCGSCLEPWEVLGAAGAGRYQGEQVFSFV